MATDKELRGELLSLFYKHRSADRYLDMRDGASPDLLGSYFRIGRALKEQGLIDWEASIDDTIGSGRVNAFGIDVVEGSSPAPFAITFHDESIHVTASQGVQIGGSGNTLSTGNIISKLVNAVDHSSANESDKQEAKSLIEKISNNKLLIAALSVLTTWSSSAH